MPTFADPDVRPTTAHVAEVLRDAADAWAALLAGLDDLGVTHEWRHYRDGGWLMKAERSGRTVAWLSVAPGCGRLSCHLAQRHRAALIAAADLPADLRAAIAAAPTTGRLVSASVEIRDAADARAALALVGHRIALR